MTRQTKNRNLTRLGAVLLALCLAAPALADIPSPGRERRQAEVSDWKQRFPDLKPELELAPAPDGKALLLHFTFKSPVDYTIKLNGREVGRGKVEELGGATRTERVPFDPPSDRESDWQLWVDYVLYGVEKTRFGNKLTDRRITDCALKRFYATREDGRLQIREGSLDGGDYFQLRQCL